MRVVRRRVMVGRLGVVGMPAVDGGLRFVGVAGMATLALVVGLDVGVVGAAVVSRWVALERALANLERVRMAGPSFGGAEDGVGRWRRRFVVPGTLGAAAVSFEAGWAAPCVATLGRAWVSVAFDVVMDRVTRRSSESFA